MDQNASECHVYVWKLKEHKFKLLHAQTVMKTGSDI